MLAQFTFLSEISLLNESEKILELHKKTQCCPALSRNVGCHIASWDEREKARRRLNVVDRKYLEYVEGLCSEKNVGEALKTDFNLLGEIKWDDCQGYASFVDLYSRYSHSVEDCKKTVWLY